ncbi:MAG: AAA family ATPase [Erysipelotrichales bacterium]|nr:AAA family ATPase [Erysipelotrichales bacterium]
MDKDIKLPQIGNIPFNHSYVIVGGNGSGKSHLGAWIENHNDNVLRISAQRALSIPDTITIMNEEASWKKIYFGSTSNSNKGHKWNWGKETSTLINDYESVLSNVFSKESNDLREFKDLCDKNNKPENFETITEKIKKIWKKILPQRDLVFEKFDAKAKFNDEIYKAGAMSDGERVCLYLISQCLITPDNYIIVIDEPEIHLHTSIMKKLWDEIEKYCPNKIFIYITHDLKFASSRKTATKIWVKSFDGKNNWEISLLDDNDEIPDSLLLEVLGTRTPVLFIEGEKSSYDLALYKEVFEDYLVIPCHNCQKVIELTKAFNNEKVRQLHSYEVKGLIDHDFLSEREIESYEKQNIYSMDVSEIENLYLIEPLIKLAAKQIGDDEDKTFHKVNEWLLKQFESKKLKIVNSLCEKEIRFKLTGFSTSGEDSTIIKKDLDTLISKIDIENIYTKATEYVEDIIRNNNYKEMLKIFNNKGLCQQVSGIIGLKKKYPQVILDLLKGEKRMEIINALKEYLPNID